MWLQYTYLALMLMILGVDLAYFGHERTRRVGLFEVVAAPVIAWTLLCCGGFFVLFGWAPKAL